ncbi:diaminopimelate epimerase [candidate division KSB1 bacterium]|nr:diaminopimelate epimerase [candidate division KSB1 bacterium]
MIPLEFMKISATGNDFILIDNRTCVVNAEKDRQLFQTLCTRRRSVGADGVILLQRSDRADFEYIHINADGSVAEMCGNGTRAIAYFARRLGIVTSFLTFEIHGQLYRAKIKDKTVTTDFSKPKHTNLTLRIVEHAGLEDGGFIDTGVPHFVIYCRSVHDLDVDGLGKHYRHHTAFEKGANIDFVEFMNKNELRVRTFERGVERETLACGTGAVAAALVSRQLNRATPLVTLHFPGGDLVVDVDTLDRITLTGLVEPVYKALLVE